MNLARIVTLVHLLLLSVAAVSQCGTPDNYCQDGGTYTACTGVVYDVGGGEAYNGDAIITICPETAGLAISLDFQGFNLNENFNPDNSDILNIYDGPDINAPILGSFSGMDLQNVSIAGSVNNPGGCLTLELLDRGPENGAAAEPNPGFQAIISCVNPCDNPSSFLSAIDETVVTQGNSITGCVGQPITFSADGSTAQPGFVITEYNWSFGNDSVESTDSEQIQYTYDEPGLYLVTLSVIDNNDCISLENIPLQVLVSTNPLFTDIASINPSYCLGTDITLNAGIVEYPTWTSLPPLIVADTLPLPDGAGFSFVSNLNFDIFDEGSIIQDCSDIVNIQTSIEHSFIGDLDISITCPNGTVVEMLPWPNGMGSTYFGEANDNDNNGNSIGIPYNYSWTTNPADPVMGDITTFNAPLPEGSYQSQGDLCALVGCPLNGLWSITINDNLAADNGWLASWTVNFAPELYPGVVTFTPTYGGGADSSFWSGPNITFLDANADVIELNLTEPGTYEYTYETSNNFGCTSDTTISITIQEPPTLFVGDDFAYQCQEVELTATLNGQPQPSCIGASEVVAYCYPDNANYLETYCPDNSGDGITFMSLNFTQGTLEIPFDDLIIYDGQNTSAPVLWNSEAVNPATLAGIEVTATNTTGCITIQLTSDGSVSCGSGLETEMIYEVSCTSDVEYVFEWTPSAGLSSAQGSTVTVEQINTTTTYNVIAYPAEFPECVVFDEITISVANDLQISLDALAQACLDSTLVLEAPEILIGTAPFTYTWTRPDGTTSNSETLIVDASQGVSEYCVSVTDVCNLTAEACIDVVPYAPIPATFQIDEGIGCAPHTVTMTSDYTAYQNLESMRWYSGDGSSTNVFGSFSFSYQNDGNFSPILELTDVNGCVYTDTLDDPIIVVPMPIADFIMNPEAPVLPETTVQFRDNSLNAFAYQYNFANLGESQEPDTEFTFPDQRGIYNIELVAFNELGCSDTIRKELVIRDVINIFIPNSFTPDGDGINDVWRVEGTGFVGQNFELVILNRWGQPVFRSTDPETPWLGDMQGNGYYSQDSLYFYILKVQDIENDVRYEYQGHIVLVR